MINGKTFVNREIGEWFYGTIPIKWVICTKTFSA
jgi:hypothetical protein